MTQKEAFFADGSSAFIIPQEPEANQMIRFFFRTLRYTKVRLRMMVLEGNDSIVQKLPMKWDHADGIFDYYITEYRIGAEVLRYWFQIDTEEEEYIYDVCGARESEEKTDDWRREAYLESTTPFRLYPGFHVPAWSKGAVMYQIFTDRFCNGDPDNDVKTGEYYYNKNYSEKVEDWYALPETSDVHRFYGGDLKGVWDKLDYLADLGVEVIYFNPLFVSPSNHKYDTQDYDHIDPHFTVIPKNRRLLAKPGLRNEGAEKTTWESDRNDRRSGLLKEGETDNRNAKLYRNRTANEKALAAGDAFFADFVKAAHEKGIRVILDGVFNHCGSFHKWMNAEGIYENAGAYDSEKSPYVDYFKYYVKKWPRNDRYEGWWDYRTLPKLNYEDSEALCEEIIRIGKKWVSPPYCADGWRLDVAADLGHSESFNHAFWKRFRKAVREANPDAIVLAEHYGDCAEWVNGKEWDTVMNYDGFMEPVTWFLTGMEKHSDGYDPEKEGDSVEFARAMGQAGAAFSAPSYYCAMNELSNHDHSRFLTRTNRKVGRLETLGAQAAEEDLHKELMLQAVVMQMTWPGAPTVYYGDEAGVCGFTDPDNRRTYPWGREDQLLLHFHKDMIRIHKENEVLKIGSVMILNTDEKLLAYGRFYFDDQIVVIINKSDRWRTAQVPVWRLASPMEGTFERLMLTESGMYHTESVPCYYANGTLVYDMPPESAVVLRRV